MTADPRLRTTRTQVGAVIAAGLLVVAIVATFIGVSTLRSSQVGEAVETADRVRVQFPSTPVVALAVVDDEDRLTSLAIGVLSPAGLGGSLVTVPVNFDTSLGFGDDRTPLSSRPFDPDDAESTEQLTADLESALLLTISHTIVLSPDAFVELISPHAPVPVDLPSAVIDAEAGAVELADSGAQDLSADEAVGIFTAIDVEGPTHRHHPIDVAMWTGFAGAVNAQPLDAEVPLDDFGRPLDPVDDDEMLSRLFSGELGVRDLAIDQAAALEVPNASGADFVHLDQFDSMLVFAEIAPSLLSTPNESLTFQIIAPFTDEQLVDLGPGATTVGLVRQLISELVFAEGNVVSVQTSPMTEGAAEATVLEVADPEFIDDVESVAPVLFGDVEVVASARVIEGVDVVAVLGTDFLLRRAEILDEEVSSADGEGGAERTSGDDELARDADAAESSDQTDETSDTVAVDE